MKIETKALLIKLIFIHLFFAGLNSIPARSFTPGYGESPYIDFELGPNASRDSNPQELKSAHPDMRMLNGGLLITQLKTAPGTPLKVKIHNLYGTLIQTLKTETGNSASMFIPLRRGLERGIYFSIVEINGGHSFKKLIIAIQ